MCYSLPLAASNSRQFYPEPNSRLEATNNSRIDAEIRMEIESATVVVDRVHTALSYLAPLPDGEQYLRLTDE